MRRTHKRIRLIRALASIAAVALLAPAASATHGSTGNGAPNGEHYTLNIIGVAKDKSASMTDSNRRTIFVDLEGKTRINLTEGEFKVLDGNGTDGVAAFQLPVADSDPTANDGQGTGETTYSVFARALGKPGGSAKVALCAEDPADGSLVCNTGDVVVELARGKGKSSFSNVSKELLYLWDVDIDGDGTIDYKRLPLFSDLLEDYFWDYDNNKLRLAQLRFYQCSTNVGAESGDPIDDSDCFGGSH
jgi:hypothetical protein